LAIIFLYLFQTGKVRSEKQLEEVNALYSKVLAHKDQELEWWRQAYTQQAERGDKQEEALRQNMEMGRTMLTMLESISRVANRTPTARGKQ
jgi:hypothetical protein